jgi:type IV secretory pathway VirD2 relaxase
MKRYNIINRNLVDNRWQQYNSHLRVNNTENTENGTYVHNNKRLTNLGCAGRAPFYLC